MCEEEILCQKKVEVEDNKEILHNNVLELKLKSKFKLS